MITNSDEPYDINLVRADHCPDIERCEHVGTTPAYPGRVQLVAKKVTDPRLIAAYAGKIGPDEILVEMGTAMLHGLNLKNQ